MINEKKNFMLYVMQIKKYVKLKKLLSKYIQHGKTNVYIHSRNVAYVSYMMARFCERRFGSKINYDVLRLGW